MYLNQGSEKGGREAMRTAGGSVQEPSKAQKPALRLGSEDMCVHAHMCVCALFYVLSNGGCGRVSSISMHLVAMTP